MKFRVRGKCYEVTREHVVNATRNVLTRYSRWSVQVFRQAP